MQLIKGIPMQNVNFLGFPFYLQPVPVQSTNCRVLSSAPLWLIGSKPLAAFWNKIYKLNFKTRITNTTITLGIW
jgi:hypothetical protein